MTQAQLNRELWMRSRHSEKDNMDRLRMIATVLGITHFDRMENRSFSRGHACQSIAARDPNELEQQWMVMAQSAKDGGPGPVKSTLSRPIRLANN